MHQPFQIENHQLATGKIRIDLPSLFRQPPAIFFPNDSSEPSGFVQSIQNAVSAETN